MEFFTRFLPPPSPAFETFGPSMTQQRFKEECDVNYVLAKYKVPQNADAEMVKRLLAVSDPAMVSAVRTGSFEDVSEVPDYAGAIRQRREALLGFQRLPVDVRMQFGNNPEIFSEFVARHPEKIGEIFADKNSQHSDTLDVTVLTGENRNETMKGDEKNERA